MLSPIFYFPQSPSIPCQQPPMPRISAIHSMRIKLSSVEGPCASSQPPKRAGTNLVVWNASFSSNHGKEYKTAPLLPFRDTLLKNFKPAAPETACPPHSALHSSFVPRYRFRTVGHFFENEISIDRANRSYRGAKLLITDNISMERERELASPTNGPQTGSLLPAPLPRDASPLETCRFEISGGSLL